MDGIYKVICDFTTDGNTTYNLSPGGLTSSYVGVDNYTAHDRLYPTYLTSYDGKQEILYNISGLGSQIARNFDGDFVKEGETTCSGRSAASYGAPASCYVDVEQKLVSTGICDEVASADDYETKCRVTCANEGTCDSIFNFAFKTVDPHDMFPQVDDLYSETDWGRNWLKEDGSRIEVWDKMEQLANQDKTYAPESLTYSFILTQDNIDAIKEYNRVETSYGGYADFTLECECNEGTTACVRCKSEFIENIYNKTIVSPISNYVSRTTIWANTQADLTNVRANNTNWNKDNTPITYERT